MELAIFTTRDRVESYLGEDRFTRLYYGNEFCERLLPTPDGLEEVLAFLRERGLAFTLVTPFVTDEGMDKALGLIEHLEEDRTRRSEAGVPHEVVVNDWGLLYRMKEAFPGLEPVLGRLLNKQKRGPRILKLGGRVPEPMMDHFRRSNVDTQGLQGVLDDFGVERVELDNLLQGMERKTGLTGSLYFPYAYVTTTRLCLTNQCFARRRHARAIFPCEHECRKITFRLDHKDMPVALFLKGNTQFFRNDRLPGNLRALGIDRIVYQPHLPMLV